MIDEEERLRQHIADHPKRVVAVDLDGTLAEFDGWKDYLHIGKPVKRIVEMVRREKKNGSYIILHTCRVATAHNKVYEASLVNIRKWLKKYNIPVDEVWMATGKPFANFYLDDKGVNPNCEECCKRENI